MAVGRPSTIRAINAEAVVALLLGAGWVTRADLARQSGLSKPSVADVVEQLSVAGVLLERATGPRTKEFSVDAGRALGAGVSLSVDALEVCVVDATGTVVAGAWRPHDPEVPAPDDIVARTIADALEHEGLGPEPLREVVVGVSASFDERHEQLRHAGSLPAWAPAAIAAALADLRGREVGVVVENDVKLALVAERHARSRQRDDHSMSLIWLGPGVGLASWVNGGIVRGSSGGAGEISYLPMGTGQLADVVGAEALADRARLLGLSGGDPASALADAAAHPSAETLRFLDEVARALLPAVASIVTVLDPGLLVLGGPIGEAGGAELVARVEAGLAELIPLPCDVEVSVVRGDAVLDGAAVVAAERARARLLESVGRAGTGGVA
jgi:predicted NBD/HSP70 family sugar kinase